MQMGCRKLKHSNTEVMHDAFLDFPFITDVQQLYRKKFIVKEPRMQLSHKFFVLKECDKLFSSLVKTHVLLGSYCCCHCHPHTEPAAEQNSSLSEIILRNVEKSPSEAKFCLS